MTWISWIVVAAILGGCLVAAVGAWSESRRKEREAYYRHETYQKMLEGSEGSAEAVRELMREEERLDQKRRVEGLELGLKLGGPITLVAGAGLAVFLYFLVDDEPVYLVGLIPLLVGLVMTAYGLRLGSK